MSDLTTGSRSSQQSVASLNAPDSPNFLDPGSLDQPVPYDAQDEDTLELDRASEGTIIEQLNEVADDSNSSNATVLLDNDAAVPAWADDEESNPVEEHSESNCSQSTSNGSRQSDEASNGQLPEVRVADSANEGGEPPAKVRKIGPLVSDEVDAETCPICLDTWGNSGKHRLVSLKCGHLFGSQCVEKWMRAQKIKERSCPTCKSKANMKDLRYIYARKLVAADTSEITTLHKQIETLQAEKCRVELELQRSKIAHRSCSLQLEVLRSTLMKSQVIKDQPARRSWRFALEKNLEIHKEGGCRVMTYNCRTYELYVSQVGSNYLFPGYGIRKVSCVDYKLGMFVHLHRKPLRDITYSQPRDLLLSVGLDSAARIVERGIPNMTVNAAMPLWSCSWDYLRSNEFYVGGVGGVIHQYDVRNPGSYIQVLNSPGDISPVVSLCSTEYGLLSCQLNSCKLWVANMRQWVPRTLPVTGSFMSLCYDNESHRVCVSSRPNAESRERAKLTLCRLKASVASSEVLCDVEDTIPGSALCSVMSRAAWVRAADSSWIAAHSESEASLHLHGVNGNRSLSLPASEPALDVTAVELNGTSLLAALSDSRLRLYKAMSTSA